MKTLTTPATSFALVTNKAAPRMPRDPHEAADALSEAQEVGEAGFEDGHYVCCQSAHDDCLMPDERSIKRIEHHEEQWDEFLRPRSPVQIEQECRSVTEWRWTLRAECPRCGEVTTMTFRPGERAAWQVVEGE